MPFFYNPNDEILAFNNIKKSGRLFNFCKFIKIRASLISITYFNERKKIFIKNILN